MSTKSSQKITFVIHALQMGGAERVLTFLANSLVERGYDVSIITLDSSERGSYFPIKPGVDVTYLNVLTAGAGIVRRFYSIIQRLWMLRRTLKHHKSGVVVAFVDITNITTLLASVGLGIPVLVAERSDPFTHVIPCFMKIMRQITYHWAHYVVTQTQGARTYFQWLPCEKVVVIPNPVPQDSPPLFEVRTCQKIISVGRLVPSKNHGLLIHAFAAVAKTHPTLTLTLYGEGAERKNLESIIAAHNLTTRVHLPGAVSQVKRYMRKADLFIFPSAYEGFPNALAEAMAAGVPVIASKCSGNTDLVVHEKTGILVEVNSQEQLTAAIIALAQDHEKRQCLALGAYYALGAFRPDVVVQQWEALIHKVLTGKALVDSP
ncbi:MAG: glycosyltransferase family 4 protein [Alphaproteobacteria bacterium]|nr:MAG: glycosyltransferase family 4 protein [Alphaproteobacteria bacterium]